MFWDKKIAFDAVINDTLHDIRLQMNEIDSIYANSKNISRDITLSDSTSRNSDSRYIVSHYHNKIKLLTQYTQDRDDLKKMHEGNGGYWGQYQRNYEECQQRLQDANFKLQLEKDMYMKLYEKNRELESKLYIAEREIEILKTGEVK